MGSWSKELKLLSGNSFHNNFICDLDPHGFLITFDPNIEAFCLMTVVMKFQGCGPNDISSNEVEMSVLPTNICKIICPSPCKGA